MDDQPARQSPEQSAKAWRLHCEGKSADARQDGQMWRLMGRAGVCAWLFCEGLSAEERALALKIKRAKEERDFLFSPFRMGNALLAKRGFKAARSAWLANELRGAGAEKKLFGEERGLAHWLEEGWPEAPSLNAGMLAVIQEESGKWTRSEMIRAFIDLANHGAHEARVSGEELEEGWPSAQDWADFMGGAQAAFGNQKIWAPSEDAGWGDLSGAWQENMAPGILEAKGRAWLEAAELHEDLRGKRVARMRRAL